VLGLFQIEVHERREDEHDDDRPHEVLVIAVGEHIADPADVLDVALGVDGADGVRSWRVLPLGDGERRELNGDVVHHQREQRFVRVPLGLEEAGDEAPDAARDDGADGHAQEKHHVIRETLRELYGEAADVVPALYGGSVNLENATRLFVQPDIDGLYVGRVAWDAKRFAGLIADCLATGEK